MSDPDKKWTFWDAILNTNPEWNEPDADEPDEEEDEPDE